jgi:hypothetical protein
MNLDYDTWDRFWEILYEADDATVVYIYRLDRNGKPIKPCLGRFIAWGGLPAMPRDEHGGGKFKILVRKGRTMVLSGFISIGVPLNRVGTQARAAREPPHRSGLTYISIYDILRT